MAANCVFCKIISGDAPGEILHQDDDMVVFKDIKPASKHHYLAVPRQHILNINYLTPEHKDLVNKMIESGKKVLQEQGGDLNDVRLGFHCPPFNSIGHLHMHVISPISGMGLLNRVIFTPHALWFITVEEVLEKFNMSVQNKI